VGYLVIKITPALPFENQARLIASLARERGYPVKYVDYISLREIRNDDYTHFLWITIGCLEFLGETLWPNIYAQDAYPEKHRLVYATIEGKPTGIAHNPNYRQVPIVAVSKFARENMEAGGLRVKDFVHHGIDMKLCRKLAKARTFRKKLDEEYGDRVKFMLVARDDPRKGIEKLSHALEIVDEKCNGEYVLLLITPKSVEEKLASKNAVHLEEYGTLPYPRLLRWMASVDYGVFPSQLEGFGLPLLEFNAVGKPVLHAWIPPLTEFSSEDFNFVWDWYDRIPMKCGWSQEWLLFDYLVENLAEAIVGAIRVYKESKKEYEEYCTRAMKHASKWDYHKVYPKLLDHLASGSVTTIRVPSFVEEAEVVW